MRVVGALFKAGNMQFLLGAITELILHCSIVIKQC